MSFLVTNMCCAYPNLEGLGGKTTFTNHNISSIDVGSRKCTQGAPPVEARNSKNSWKITKHNPPSQPSPLPSPPSKYLLQTFFQGVCKLLLLPNTLQTWLKNNSIYCKVIAKDKDLDIGFSIWYCTFRLLKVQFESKNIWPVWLCGTIPTSSTSSGGPGARTCGGHWIQTTSWPLAGNTSVTGRNTEIQKYISDWQKYRNTEIHQWLAEKQL